MKKNNDEIKIIEEEKSDKKNEIAVLTFSEQVTHNKYMRELEIESEIIVQASQMQAAFSFLAAAIAMLVPVACEYRGNMISLNLILAIFTPIFAAVLFSLVCSTLAHQRRKHNEEEDADNLNKYINEKKDLFIFERHRLNFLIKTYIELQKSMSETNANRLKWLRLSTYSFYVAIGLCVVGYFVYVINM